MKISLLFFVVFAALAAGAIGQPVKDKAADTPFLQKQKQVLEILFRIQQHSLLPEQVSNSEV